MRLHEQAKGRRNLRLFGPWQTRHQRVVHHLCIDDQHVHRDCVRTQLKRSGPQKVSQRQSTCSSKHMWSLTDVRGHTTERREACGYIAWLALNMSPRAHCSRALVERWRLSYLSAICAATYRWDRVDG